MLVPMIVPADETARLAALHQTGLLDSDPERAYDDLVAIATGICGTPMGAISLIDADRQWFKARIGIDDTETSRQSAFCAHTILTPEDLLIVPDATLDARFRDNELVVGGPGIRFYAGAPLRARGGEALGSLCVIDSQPRTLEPFQLDALRSLSRQVGALIELRLAYQALRHQMDERSWYEQQLIAQNEQLAEQTRTDALTGLPNRRAFDAALAKAIEQAARGGSLSLAMIDVDHFKIVNDLHGHPRGDEILVAVAQVIHDQRGRQGFCARYGGEEFALLMPDIGDDTAEYQCEFLREGVQAIATGIPVTASIGLATFRSGDTGASMLARADQALYEAKRSGRNRVMRG